MAHTTSSTAQPWVEALDSNRRDRLARLARASDFAMAVLDRQPCIREALLANDGEEWPAFPVLATWEPQEWGALLRHWRKAASTRLVWRDVLGLDSVDDTLFGSTRIAERCLDAALRVSEEAIAQRHGVVRDASGDVQRLVVYGLGKLGGSELNFSSDVDLVFAYTEDGESDGTRPLPAEQYFARVGQQLAKLLDDVTADGFCHRVDLRLRPFGNAGRLAWSFAALEQYFQREGRDWERYAWQKARAVAGDVEVGERFLARLKPFIYRRYLDFGALDGLRGMKALIDAEVARRDMQSDIKRGPGGIREIEFLAQALQLIRGGRESALQVRGTRAALRALIEAGHLQADVGEGLLGDYAFLRRLENRIQMLRDAQVHVLPETKDDQARLAQGLGYREWGDLLQQIDAHRAHVSGEFARLLAAPRSASADAAGVANYWNALPDDGDCAALTAAGFADAAEADVRLRGFAKSLRDASISEEARSRVGRLMPALLAAVAGAPEPALALQRALALLGNVLRRSSYVVLLQESPRALERLLVVLSRSALLAERLAAYPLLLDELLDGRVSSVLPGHQALQQACADAAQAAGGDTELFLARVNEVRQAASFRIGLAVLDGRERGTDGAARLAALADAVLAQVVRAARTELERAHGAVPDARFAVLGYGSLGGQELGFGSDLDLVFLYNAPDDAVSTGTRPLDAARWHARLTQKIVALLQAPTAAGRLYDVDVRLRPDGAKGLLVTRFASFAEYQRERAWTWEHQALVRSRCVVPDADGELAGAFEALRAEVLARPRDADGLRSEVTAMRQRMRGELDRSNAGTFDLKQGEGGLVDLEFLVQAGVLACAARAPVVVQPRGTVALLHALAAAGWMTHAEAIALAGAHQTLVAAGMACTLDRRPRLVTLDGPVSQAREVVIGSCQLAGLDFSPADHPGPGAP